MATPCKYCDAQLRFIQVNANKTVPCNFDPVVRHGSDPPPKGIYFDIMGNRYQDYEVPCGVQVYRSHWSDCPGASKARRPR